MKLSALLAFMAVNGVGTNDNVSYGALSHLADDDVAKPEHVEEKAANFQKIVEQKEAEASGAAIVSKLASGGDVTTAVAGAIDYDKLAAAMVKATRAATEEKPA